MKQIMGAFSSPRSCCTWPQSRSMIVLGFCRWSSAKQPRTSRKLRLLTLTRCQGIVTTNFDRSLQIAAGEAVVSLVHFGESDQDLAAARVEAHKFLVRLHGRIEVPESLVFADRHYRTLPERESYVEFFRQLFVNRNLVFLRVLVR